LCTRRFDALNRLQEQLIAEGISDVKIAAVSMVEFADRDKVGFFVGNSAPVVQDTTAANVGEAWTVRQRDLVILDRQGRFVSRINLTAFDPDPAVNNGENFNLLKSQLLAARTSTDPSISGNLVFQLFDDLAPRTTERVSQLVDQGFYNGLSFHRVINEFLALGGDPAGNGTGGSGIRFDDEFNRQLTFTGYGQLAMMANSGDDTNDSQFFITDQDLRLTPFAEVTSKVPPAHLNFDHSIFGQLIEGFDLFQQIMLTPVTGSRPVSGVVINDATIFDDLQNAVLRLSAPVGFTGSSTITVTATNTEGIQTQRSFQVNVVADTRNDRPFLGALENLGTTQGTPVSFTIPAATDLENDALTYVVRDATNFANLPANVIVSLDQVTRQVTLTPAAGFTGAINMLVGVRDGTRRVDTNGDTVIDALDDINARGNFDTQRVTLTVRPAGTRNGIPALSAAATHATTVDRPVEFVVTGLDPDADQTIFAATVLVNENPRSELNLRADEHVEGGALAQVTLIEYLDFQ
jgi:cyclophilin family peptidyl-prolyl cis-trans isomerase